MHLNRAVLLFTLLISSYGLLEGDECDASCDVDQNGKSMLQVSSSQGATRRASAAAATITKARISTKAIDLTCDFENTDTNSPATIVGEAPTGPGPWPLAVYLQGTYMSWANGVATAFHEQMAQRYFYSVSIQYSNMEYAGDCNMFTTKASNVAGCINNILCQEREVDCSLGLAMYGWSQGGQVSSLVGNYTRAPVTGWFGFSSTYINYLKGEGKTRDDQAECLKLKTPQHKRRILIGDIDGLMGGDGTTGSGTPAVVIANVKEFQGPLTCKTDYDCIQEDGSGYFVGTEADTGVLMTHTWFIDFSFTPPSDVSMSLIDAFKNPPNPSAEWGEQTTFDWLASTALTSNECDWSCYYDRYPALKINLVPADGASAKAHYENYGKAEGRDCTCHKFPECDWHCYLNRYPKLQVNLHPANLVTAKKHYEEYGLAEGRDCTCR